jgi:chromosome segregation ATPase
MIRKILISTGTVLLLGVLMFGRQTAGYLKTSFGYLHNSVKNSVPVGFEIDRARDMIKDLAPEVRKNMHVIAQEEVELARLEEQVASNESRLDKEKDQILRLKNDLAQKKTVYQYADRDYTPDEVKSDLANRFERFKTGEATLASLKQIHTARERSLSAAKQKLDAMLAQKRQLQVEVENLEARNQMIAANQATSNYQFDDSQLGQAKELVQDLRTRIDVTEKLVNSENAFQGEIPLDKAVPQNIEEKVSDYFAPAKPDSKAVVSVEKK